MLLHIKRNFNACFCHSFLSFRKESCVLQIPNGMTKKRDMRLLGYVKLEKLKFATKIRFSIVLQLKIWDESCLKSLMMKRCLLMFWISCYGNVPLKAAIYIITYNIKIIDYQQIKIPTRNTPTVYLILTSILLYLNY